MKYFLVLSQDGLVIYSKKNQLQLLTFPPQAIRHQEIVNQKMFEEFLQSFFSHLIKQETILYLSNELIFSGSVPMTNEFVLEDEQKKFIDILPFSSETVEIVHIKTKTVVYFFATNSDLYKTILAIAHKNNCTIKHIVPLVLFGQSLRIEQLTSQELSKFSKQKDMITQGDFLLTGKSEKNTTSIFKRIVLLIITLSLLGGVLIWSLYKTGLLFS
jgi:hypothetical protein